MSDWTDAQAVRRYIVRVVTLVLDNDQEWSDRLWVAASEAVTATTNEEDFAAMLARGTRQLYSGDDVYDNLAIAVGNAVVEVLHDLCDTVASCAHETAHLLLTDLLDLGDTEQVRMFGQNYLPECVEDVSW